MDRQGGTKTSEAHFVLPFERGVSVCDANEKMIFETRDGCGKIPGSSAAETRRIFFRVTIALAILLVALAGCGRKHRRAGHPPPAPKPQASGARSKSSASPAVPAGHTEEGVASWYGNPFNGRAAADGEIYDMETLVAAHRLLPFNTWLRVTNLSNNKTVDVRVIDRGPFVGGRIIDLSKAAARKIDLLGPGVGRVRLQVIASPQDVPVNDFYAVQVGAFATHANAEAARQQYAGRFGNAQLALRQGRTPLWRVLVGKERSVEAAQQLAIVLAAENKNVFVVRLDETELRNAGSEMPPAPAAEHPPQPASNQSPPSGAQETQPPQFQ